MSSDASVRAYQPGLTGLRGVAALAVLGYHAWLFAGSAPLVLALGGVTLDLSAPLRCGYFGVDLFFVLSGFLLSQPFLRAFAQRRAMPSLRRYWLHRCRRVLPAYWVQLAILAAVYLVLGTPVVAVRDLVAHAALVQNLAPWLVARFNAVYWSMPVEWDFYVALPLLAWLLTRCRWWLAATAVLVWVVAFRLLCFASLFDPALRWLSFGAVHQLPGRLDQFFLGVLAAWATIERPQVLRHARLWLAAGLAGIAAMVALAAPRGDFLVHLDMPYLLWHHSFVAAAFAAIVLGTAAATRFGERMFANAPLRFFGAISYSLYLWHYPLLSALRGLGWFDGGRVPAAVAALCALPPIVLVAWLSHRYIERPFLRASAPARSDGASAPAFAARLER